MQDRINKKINKSNKIIGFLDISKHTPDYVYQKISDSNELKHTSTILNEIYQEYFLKKSILDN